MSTYCVPGLSCVTTFILDTASLGFFSAQHTVGAQERSVRLMWASPSPRLRVTRSSCQTWWQPWQLCPDAPSALGSTVPWLAWLLQMVAAGPRRTA